LAHRGLSFVAGDEEREGSRHDLSLVQAVTDKLASSHFDSAAVNGRDALPIGFEIVVREGGMATIPHRDEAENSAFCSRGVLFEKTLCNGKRTLFGNE